MGPDTRSQGALTLDSIVGLSPPELLQPFWALGAETPGSVPVRAGGSKSAVHRFLGRACCPHCRRPPSPCALTWWRQNSGVLSYRTPTSS